jgi:hypothetical protein
MTKILGRVFVISGLLLISNFTVSAAQADMCLDQFAPTGASLTSSEAIALVFNSKSGRNELHLGRITGRDGTGPLGHTEMNIATGILRFENRAVFAPVVPFRVHAKVLDTRDTFKRVEDRIVTVLGTRESPKSWDKPGLPEVEHVAEREDGTLVRVVEIIDYLP